MTRSALSAVLPESTRRPAAARVGLVARARAHVEQDLRELCGAIATPFETPVESHALARDVLGPRLNSSVLSEKTARSHYLEEAGPASEMEERS
jgi:hypothetical protein